MRNVAASLGVFAPSILNCAVTFGQRPRPALWSVGVTNRTHRRHYVIKPYLNYTQRPDESKIFGIINLCTTDVPNCISLKRVKQLGFCDESGHAKFPFSSVILSWGDLWLICPKLPLIVP